MEKYGYTPHCSGCYAVKNKRWHKPHNETCRKRIIDEVTNDDGEKRRVGLYKERKERWHDKLTKEEEKVTSDKEADIAKQDVQVENELKVNEPNMEIDNEPKYAEAADTEDFYKVVDDEVGKWVQDIPELVTMTTLI